MKYKITNETLEYGSKILHRIECVNPLVTREGTNINTGDKGGWIEKESNLSQDGDCWIYQDGIVCDNAIVEDDAFIDGGSVVRDSSTVSGSAQVLGCSELRGMVILRDDAVVRGCSDIGSQEDGIVHIGGCAEVDNTEIVGYVKVLGKSKVIDSSISSTSHDIDVIIRIDGNAAIVSSKLEGDQIEIAQGVVAGVKIQTTAPFYEYMHTISELQKKWSSR